jgi:hypothetical protein
VDTVSVKPAPLDPLSAIVWLWGLVSPVSKLKERLTGVAVIAAVLVGSTFSVTGTVVVAPPETMDRKPV